MSENLVTRLAATVLALRDTSQGFEVLMLRRNLNSDFVGGAYVFPGGGVDPTDSTPEAAHRTWGADDAAASQQLNLATGGLAFYVAALRELFEEAGLLVARGLEGDALALKDRALRARLVEYRRMVNAKELRFVDVLERESLFLDIGGVAYLAHWVTPLGAPRRFDTRFFVVMTPEGQTATHDAGETVADRWLRPREALDAHGRGELVMILPTIRTLESIADYASAREVMSYARNLSTVPRVEPRLVRRAGETQILLPGDPDYGD